MFYLKIKRIIDLLLSLIGLIVLSPLLLLIVIAIKIDSPGPALFKQKRIGIHKSHFNILKFRTMRIDTPKDTPTHLLENPDQWITRIGKFLRKTSLDELPQIINILLGDMAIVGPRPALWNQYDLIAERDKYGANDVPVGLTGWAQINGRDELENEVKAKLDGVYAKKIGFLMDVRCFFVTIWSVVKFDGVVEGGTGFKAKATTETSISNGVNFKVEETVTTGDKMKVVILNCFETNENRVQVIYDFFSKNLNEVIVVQSDFKHILKSHRKDKKDNHIFVKSKPYFKNLSIKRLISHYKFSKDAISIVEKENPDLLYVIFPPNSLAKFASKYKKYNQNVKLIFDIMDLWPETMPIGIVKKFPTFTFWGELRDKSLKHADLVITECDLYQSVLGDVLKGIRVETLHLAKREINVVSNSQLSYDEIHLAYLGSINNIIDIPRIKDIIETIKKVKPVTLHIVGDGESKEELIASAKAGGASVEYHGKVYDDQEKQDIFDICHFGLNIMKNSVCVGLTLKSIDYFQHGLPIINNIPADTEEIVEKYGVGVNVIDGSDFTYDYFKNVLNLDFNYCMKERALRLFKEKFSVQAFNSSFECVYEELINL